MALCLCKVQFMRCGWLLRMFKAIMRLQHCLMFALSDVNKPFPINCSTGTSRTGYKVPELDSEDCVKLLYLHRSDEAFGSYLTRATCLVIKGMQGHKFE